MNSKEPLSRYAQRRRGIKVEQLEVAVDIEAWLPVFADDRRVSVADQAALRIDTREWLGRLSDRLRKIAGDLALGFSTSEVAQRYRLSPGRISQLRSELYDSWAEFQGVVPAAA
jgi:DNA-binding NarL/FixJ family response regulator